MTCLLHFWRIFCYLYFIFFACIPKIHSTCNYEYFVFKCAKCFKISLECIHKITLLLFTSRDIWSRWVFLVWCNWLLATAYRSMLFFFNNRWYYTFFCKSILTDKHCRISIHELPFSVCFVVELHTEVEA